MRRIIPVALIFLLVTSCGSNHNNVKQKTSLAKQDLEELNRYMVEKDRERIESYVERKGLTMQENSMGLWYGIINKGTGELIKDNDRVVYEYECSLLDGTICYSSVDDGNRDVIIGKSEMEAGLDIALKMLKLGGEGVFILPPYMAFGLKGDGINIPSRSVLVYEIKVLKISAKK